MKKRYILIFLLAFVGCFTWVTWHDPKPAPAHTSHPVTASAVKNTTTSAAPANTGTGGAADFLLPAEIREYIAPYLHFRQLLDDRVKKKDPLVALSAMPRHLRQAVLATEDRRFYEHGPVDFIGITRATLVNLQSGEALEGGSTISQQVVKNIFLTQDKTLLRKAQEVALAILLEKDYSKDNILEIYLNTAYFGANAYGIDEAAETYFHTTPENLTLAQSAMLAGLLQAPSYYNPLEHYEAAKKRQQTVLALMAEQGLILPKTAADAYHENLGLPN